MSEHGSESSDVTKPRSRRTTRRIRRTADTAESVGESTGALTDREAADIDSPGETAESEPRPRRSSRTASGTGSRASSRGADAARRARSEDQPESARNAAPGPASARNESDEAAPRRRPRRAPAAADATASDSSASNSSSEPAPRPRRSRRSDEAGEPERAGSSRGGSTRAEATPGDRTRGDRNGDRNGDTVGDEPRRTTRVRSEPSDESSFGEGLLDAFDIPRAGSGRHDSRSAADDSPRDENTRGPAGRRRPDAGRDHEWFDREPLDFDAGDEPAAGRLAADRTSSDRTGSDRTGADRPGTGRIPDDRTENDRTGDDRAVGARSERGAADESRRGGFRRDLLRRDRHRGRGPGEPGQAAFGADERNRTRGAGGDDVGEIDGSAAPSQRYFSTDSLDSGSEGVDSQEGQGGGRRRRRRRRRGRGGAYEGGPETQDARYGEPRRGEFQSEDRLDEAAGDEPPRPARPEGEFGEGDLADAPSREGAPRFERGPADFQDHGDSADNGQGRRRRRRRNRRGGPGDGQQQMPPQGGRRGNDSMQTSRHRTRGGQQGGQGRFQGRGQGQGQGQGQYRGRGGQERHRDRGFDRGPRPQFENDLSGDITETVEAVLELHPKGFGFLRDPGKSYLAQETDPFVSGALVDRYRLREGLLIRGGVGPGPRGQGPRLKTIDTIDGRTPDEYSLIKNFDDLTPINPFEQIKLETGPRPVTTRVMDLLTPIGKGQRALIVAPPRSGKTMLLQDIADAVSKNHPELHLIVVLIDERPEEVTELKRRVRGEVIASSMDRDVENHIRVSQLIFERAKRLAESGREVFVLLDSITRLGRAFNKGTNTGRTTQGGIDVRALDIPRKLFGTARRFDEGGSLTVVGTALIDTGSKGDEVIFQEFKGTGNMELVLSRDLADRRIWPAMDIKMSGTRREEMILSKETLDGVTMLRRSLVTLSQVEAMETLIRTLDRFPTNKEFLARVKSML